LSVFFVAQIRIHDPAEYRKYLDGCDEIFAKYNGEYLAVDDNPAILEGDWDYTKIVIIRFLNENDLRRWYESEEYQELRKFRLNAAQCDTLLVKGRN